MNKAIVYDFFLFLVQRWHCFVRGYHWSSTISLLQVYMEAFHGATMIESTALSIGYNTQFSSITDPVIQPFSGNRLEIGTV